MANQIIICGYDMILDLLANRLNQCVWRKNVFRSYKGSYNGLYAMYQGEVNVATAHLWHGKTNSYNIPYISSMLLNGWIVLHLLKRKQGFYVKKGNPKRIQSFEDLKRADVTIINREPGSGVRVLVDEKLRQAGISTQEVNGYQKVVNSHLEAAATVKQGRSRCGSWKRKAQPVCTRNRFYFHTGRKLRYGNPKKKISLRNLIRKW